MCHESVMRFTVEFSLLVRLVSTHLPRGFSRHFVFLAQSQGLLSRVILLEFFDTLATPFPLSLLLSFLLFDM